MASASPSASEQSFQSVEDKEEVGSKGKRDMPPQYSKGYPIGEMPIFLDCGRRSAHAETRRSSALDDDPCGDVPLALPSKQYDETYQRAQGSGSPSRRSFGETCATGAGKFKQRS